jgi:hypothetical protein
VNAFERAAQLDPNNSETAAALDSARMNLNGEEESISRRENIFGADEFVQMNVMFITLILSGIENCAAYSASYRVLITHCKRQFTSSMYQILLLSIAYCDN